MEGGEESDNVVVVSRRLDDEFFEFEDAGLCELEVLI